MIYGVVIGHGGSNGKFEIYTIISRVCDDLWSFNGAYSVQENMIMEALHHPTYS